MKRPSLFADRGLAGYLLALPTKLMALAFITFSLAACSDGSDDKTPLEQKLGNYEVSDLFEADEEPETYNMKLTKSALGEPNIEITNFGDIMNIPIDAVIEADSLFIPAQTFNGKSMTITITGEGKFEGNALKFDYVIETDDDYVLEHTCEAVRK